ncbi:STAS domain-containing protein [Nocardia thailandica]|uniref:STAS domain-containing protein n=1 Tax=Nocardia thailandica TaxID=257275 RepID=A0ABW6PI53_9NOCA
MRADLEPCGQTAILHVHGEIDAYTLPRWQELLEATVTTLAAEGDRHLIVDLTGTDFVSVRAIMSLAELTTQSCRRRISLR